MISGKPRAYAIGVLACILGFLAFSYTTKGTYCLVFGQSRSDAVDLHLRWVEERYFLHGQNPYDVWRQHHPRATTLLGPAPATGRNDTVDPQFGGTDPTHPPWGYLSGLPLLWPDWPAARTYYAIVNAIALLLIAAWAYAWGRSQGKSAGLLAALAALAIAGNCTALEGRTVWHSRGGATGRCFVAGPNRVGSCERLVGRFGDAKADHCRAVFLGIGATRAVPGRCGRLRLLGIGRGCNASANGGGAVGSSSPDANPGEHACGTGHARLHRFASDSGH